MERHPIQKRSGLKVIGSIGEVNGSGFRDIGRGDRSPMLIGFLDVGNQEMGVGSGSRAIGSTDKKEFKSYNSILLTHNFN
jgi:hypothetical protein